MRVPFGTISITPESRRLVNSVLDSGKVSNGRYVRELEERFAALTGSAEAVAVSSGTDAATLALAVLHDFGAARGDQVMIPALSFVATGNSVLHAGLEPVFVDIERDTLNIDAGQIEGMIAPSTRAIVPVHLMGKPADMDAINSIARKHGLWVIEDAAEAHGARYKGRNVGTLGDMAAYSLYLAHIISTVEGGIVVTDRADVAEVLRSLRSHGRACKCKVCSLNVGKQCAKRFEYGTDTRFLFERVGYSTKMNELEAAVGLGNLSVYDEILAARRRNLLEMTSRFEKYQPWLLTFKESADEEVGPHAFPFIVRERAGFNRDELAGFLEDRGIETRHLFSSIPTQCGGYSYLGHKLGEFPNAEFVGSNGLHIGVHQDIGTEHIDYIVDTVERFLSDHAA